MLDLALRPAPARARRGAIWDLFLRVAPEAAQLPVEPAAEPDCSPPQPYQFHPARAAAHAAYAEVVGGGPRALDAALSVVEAELRAARLRALQQEEALKLLRLYATDQWARSVAERALEPAPNPRPAALAACLPRTLHDPDLTEGRACTCGDLMVETARQHLPLVTALLAGLAAAAAALAAGLGFAVAAVAYTFAGIGVCAATTMVASRPASPRIVLRTPNGSPSHG